ALEAREGIAATPGAQDPRDVLLEARVVEQPGRQQLEERQREVRGAATLAGERRDDGIGQDSGSAGAPREDLAHADPEQRSLATSQAGRRGGGGVHLAWGHAAGEQGSDEG